MAELRTFPPVAEASKSTSARPLTFEACRGIATRFIRKRSLKAADSTANGTGRSWLQARYRNDKANKFVDAKNFSRRSVTVLEPLKRLHSHSN